MTVKRTRDILSLIDGIRGENLSGRWASDEWVKRQFSFLTLDAGQTTNTILKALAGEDALLRFRYADHDYYVLNERYPVQEVLHRSIQQAFAQIREQQGRKLAPEDASRLGIQMSLLQAIQDALEKALAKLPRMDRFQAEKILEANRVLKDRLMDQVNQGTRKFKEAFQQRDLLTLDAVRRNRNLFAEGQLLKLFEMLDALENRHQVVAVPLADQDRALLDSAQLDGVFMNRLQEQRSRAKQAAEDPKKSGAETKGMSTYQRYMLLDNLARVIEQARLSLSLEDPSALLPSDEDGAETVESTVGEESAFSGGEAVAGAARTEEGAEPRLDLPGHAEDIAWDTLDDAKLDDLCMRSLTFESSRQQVRELLGLCRSDAEAPVKLAAFRSLVACWILLVRVGGSAAERRERIAQVYLGRLGASFPAAVRDEAVRRLDQALHLAKAEKSAPPDPRPRSVRETNWEHWLYKK